MSEQPQGAGTHVNITNRLIHAGPLWWLCSECRWMRRHGFRGWVHLGSVDLTEDDEIEASFDQEADR